jgi:hypothetical protein
MSERMDHAFVHLLSFSPWHKVPTLSHQGRRMSSKHTQFKEYAHPRIHLHALPSRGDCTPWHEATKLATSSKK